MLFCDTSTSSSEDLLHLLGPPELFSSQCLQIEDRGEKQKYKEDLWTLEHKMPRAQMHGVFTASDIHTSTTLGGT